MQSATISQSRSVCVVNTQGGKMILSAVSSSPELLSIDKNTSLTISDSVNVIATGQSSEQILTSSSESPEETLTDKIELSYEAKRQAENAQYAEYELYAQSVAAEEINTQIKNESEQDQNKSQIVVTFPGVNLLV